MSNTPHFTSHMLIPRQSLRIFSYYVVYPSWLSSLFPYSFHLQHSPVHVILVSSHHVRSCFPAISAAVPSGSSLLQSIHLGLLLVSLQLPTPMLPCSCNPCFLSSRPYHFSLLWILFYVIYVCLVFLSFFIVQLQSPTLLPALTSFFLFTCLHHCISSLLCSLAHFSYPPFFPRQPPSPTILAY